MRDCWLTTGDLKRWIEEHKLPDNTKIYVQMPSSVNAKKENLHDPIVIYSEQDGDCHYVRGWGPSLMLKEKKMNLYIDIYY